MARLHDVQAALDHAESQARSHVQRCMYAELELQGAQQERAAIIEDNARLTTLLHSVQTAHGMLKMKFERLEQQPRATVPSSAQSTSGMCGGGWVRGCMCVEHDTCVCVCL